MVTGRAISCERVKFTTLLKSSQEGCLPSSLYRTVTLAYFMNEWPQVVHQERITYCYVFVAWFVKN